MRDRKRIVILFPNEWDREHYSKSTYTNAFEFIYYGVDLFKFPRFLQLVFFNSQKFIKNLASFCKSRNVQGILSSDEYIGAIIAAVVAKELGLPGGNIEAIITAQHKYHSRICQKSVLPSITPAFELININKINLKRQSIPFPFFVKPVKGTFSLFAKKVESEQDFKTKFSLSLIEKFFLKRVMRPYNDLLKAYTSLNEDAFNFIGEELIEGDQFTVDGFVWKGNTTVLGIVDSVMFPGTNIFERFEYPSLLDEDIQDRIARIVEKTISSLGFVNGQFNVEVFYNHKTDEIRVIEVNPRLSYQFADLYENVDGLNTYDILLALTLGEEPRFRLGAGRFQYSTSFVYRTFQGKEIVQVPDSSSVEAFGKRYPESQIRIYGKVGAKTKSEMRAIGSYRYAIVNVGAQSRLDLIAISEDCLERLNFEFN